MKLSKKRTCYNCKSYSPNTHLICDLLFKFKTKFNHKFGFSEHFPLEPCYKPKTNKEWLKAHSLKR